MIDLIGKCANGKVFRCDKCNKIHVEYKNLSFNLNNKQFVDFVNIMLELDGEEWEEKNRDSYYSRKIILPTGNKNICFLLNNQELNELRGMLTNNSKHNSGFVDSFINDFSFITYKN